jgi:hypothetical protein
MRMNLIRARDFFVHFTQTFIVRARKYGYVSFQILLLRKEEADYFRTVKNKHDFFLLTTLRCTLRLLYTIYFRLRCNLLLLPFPLTTCFGCTRPSSGASNSLELLHYMVYPNFHITCDCDIS